uniref:tumor necrosis factor receptor superfamily member 1A isoform X2 n=1 Tax=Monopterus albus TaxID=43700 RepID=UPI0009B37AC6|nr:tumor necrosis factor receptor superfamily member 1A-like isoform X2 [Monopterus albus]
MIYSSNMNFVLVFPVVLGYLASGQNATLVVKQTNNSCYNKCPPGYHKVKGAQCDDPRQHKCKQCENNSFTEIENFIDKCMRCATCGNYEVEIHRCNSTNNVKCDCRDNYYNAAKSPKDLACQSCLLCKKCSVPENPDYIRKCTCTSACLKDPECKKKCPTTTISPSKSTATRPTPLDPSMEPVPLAPVSWLLCVVGAISLVLYGLLLLFITNLLGKPDSCPCWSPNKDIECHAEEQTSHQDKSPTAVMLNITEDFPMLALSQSPSTPEHPAHNRPPLPNAEHEDAVQDEQSKHWPAIVLYAIIKEVPLRRWKEFLRLLSMADEQLERVELEVGLGLSSVEMQYQMLRLWSQRSSASLNDVFSALHYMDLSGCAQLLQESLEKLQSRPETKQEFTACRN